MNSISTLLHLAQKGDKDAEATLVACYEPAINKYAKRNRTLDEDYKQQLTISFRKKRMILYPGIPEKTARKPRPVSTCNPGLRA
ncbi:helix-turn-helix domain-containing protein [Paenibacillus peoriae]|uniref:helix-turn-helix domain-containing protein n=1 Tax=Paenibacillus peoriae TaxID=59893 RepID=UPI00026C5C63|nr:helix-turn-helix domain-containing protein [Paenibacillus peoriae]MEC0184667.1 helix-turn-helix domain-containing protein [Paenibacillus peoriae]